MKNLIRTILVFLLLPASCLTNVNGEEYLPLLQPPKSFMVFDPNSNSQTYSVNPVSKGVTDEISADTADTMVSIVTNPTTIASNGLSVEYTVTGTYTQCKWSVGTPPFNKNGQVDTVSPATTTGYTEGVNYLYIGCKKTDGTWVHDSIKVVYDPPVPADVDKHYVISAGGGNRDGTSWKNAWSRSDFNTGSNGAICSTAKAKDGAIGPGDYVFFGGTFANGLIIRCSGDASDPIVYDGYESSNGVDVTALESTSGRAHIKMSSQAFGDQQYGITAEAKSYFIIQDFEISNGSHGIVLTQGCSNITYKRNYVHDMGAYGFYHTKLFGRSENDPKYITVGGNRGNGNRIMAVGAGTASGDVVFSNSSDIVVSWNRLYSTPAYGAGKITDLGNDGVVVIGKSEKVLIEYNIIYGHNDMYYADPYGNNDDRNKGIGEQGFDIKSDNTDWPSPSNIVIRFNDIYDHYAINPSSGSDIAFGGTFQIGSNNGLIYGNRLMNNRAGLHISEGNTSDYAKVYNLWIWANLIYDNTRFGINSATTAAADKDSHDIYIWNNTLDNNARAQFPIVRSSQTNITFTAFSLKGDNIVMNNIISRGRSADTDYIQVYSAGNNIEYDHNLYYWPGQTSKSNINGSLANSISFESNPVSVDSTTVFNDLNNGDYTLIDGSPAIDKGANIISEGKIKAIPSFKIQGVAHGAAADFILGAGTIFEKNEFPIIDAQDQDESWDIGAMQLANRR